MHLTSSHRSPLRCFAGPETKGQIRRKFWSQRHRIWSIYSEKQTLLSLFLCDASHHHGSALRLLDFVQLLVFYPGGQADDFAALDVQLEEGDLGVRFAKRCRQCRFRSNRNDDEPPMLTMSGNQQTCVTGAAPGLVQGPL